MADWTGIFNQAILPLGQRELTSIDDQATGARKCKAVYLGIFDEVISVHPWKVALARAILAANATPPVFGPAFAFDLPTDPFCLRAWQIGDCDGNWWGERDGKWEVEGRQILTDLPAPLKLRYIARLDDPNTCSGLLAIVIATRLRAEVAFALTSSRTDEQSAQNDYKEQLAEARSLDSQQGTPQHIGGSRILAARY